MRRFNDFHPDDEHIPEIDEIFAELCRNLLGTKSVPASDADVNTDISAHTDTDTSADTRNAKDWDPSVIDYPGLWDEPKKPTAPEKPTESEKPAVAATPAAPTKPAASAAPKAAHAAPAAHAQPKTAAPKKKKKKRRGFLLGLIPQKGDSTPEIIRKCVCFVALLVFIVSACVLLDDFVIEPMRGARVSNKALQNIVDPITPEEANYNGYPAGILEKFKKNYYHNHDLIGWISYPCESEYWHGINYPVVQRPGDNDYYLKRDFDQNNNKNGSIFMDFRCDFNTPNSTCRLTWIYGHNMRDGQMFASLNQLLDLSMARMAPTFTFSSLFEENQYKVFAVFNVDTAEEGAYDFLNKSIDEENEFVQYIAEMRVRSWFDYTDVDVNVGDDIVVLYTCSNTYQTTMGKSGRTLVAARKVRPGESATVDPSSIVENSGCVMPKVWYANKGLSLPAYYQTGVSEDYLNDVGRTTPTTAATTKPTTTKTTKPTTTTTPEPDEPDDEDEDEDDVIAPTAPARTTRPTTTATTVPTTVPTTAATPEPTTTAPTEPEPSPTDTKPTANSEE